MTKINVFSYKNLLIKLINGALVGLFKFSPIKHLYFTLGFKKQTQTFVYFIETLPLQSILLIRNLGILFDVSMSFKDHISKIRAMFKIYQFFRILNSTNPKLWFMAFKIYIRPIFEYSSEIWNPSDKNQIIH